MSTKLDKNFSILWDKLGKIQNCAIKHNFKVYCQKDSRGFVLIELLVAMGIVAILSTFGYMSYQRYAIRKDISNGQQYLLEFQQKQGIHYLNHQEYAASASDLGMPPAPLGSESRFEPVKMVILKGEDVAIGGAEFYTAILDVKNNVHPPLIISENGSRWFEHTPECHKLAYIGADSHSVDYQSLSAIDRLRIMAKCTFDAGDQRWDEVVNTGSRTSANLLAAVPQNNPLNAYYLSLPEELTGEIPQFVPADDPSCDSEEQNKKIPAGSSRNFTVDGYLKTCFCTQSSAIMEQNSITKEVVCRTYTACGIEEGTYVENISPAGCNEVIKCDAATNQLNGAVEPNIKSSIIYADPNNDGNENGYRVWCSARGVLTIDGSDPTKSTCYPATCSEDGKVVLDEGNNLAQYETVFSCQDAKSALGNNETKEGTLVTEDATGDLYEVTCNDGSLNFDSGDFRQSTCSSYICSQGQVGVGE